MEPYYDYTQTHGPVNPGAGIDSGGHQLFGAGTEAASNWKIPPRTTVWSLINQKPVNLWGMGATSAEAATVAVFSGVVIGGLAINYALGRYVGVALVEYMSNNKLSLSQKRAIGVTTVLF